MGDMYEVYKSCAYFDNKYFKKTGYIGHVSRLDKILSLMHQACWDKDTIKFNVSLSWFMEMSREEAYRDDLQDDYNNLEKAVAEYYG